MAAVIIAFVIGLITGEVTAIILLAFSEQPKKRQKKTRILKNER